MTYTDKDGNKITIVSGVVTLSNGLTVTYDDFINGYYEMADDQHTADGDNDSRDGKRLYDSIDSMIDDHVTVDEAQLKTDNGVEVDGNTFNNLRRD